MNCMNCMNKTTCSELYFGDLTRNIMVVLPTNYARAICLSIIFLINFSKVLRIVSVAPEVLKLLSCLPQTVFG